MHLMKPSLKLLFLNLRVLQLLILDDQSLFAVVTGSIMTVFCLNENGHFPVKKEFEVYTSAFGDGKMLNSLTPRKV